MYIAKLRAGVDRDTADQWLALAFATLRRVADPPSAATQLNLFPDLDEAPSIEELLA